MKLTKIFACALLCSAGFAAASCSGKGADNAADSAADTVDSLALMDENVAILDSAAVAQEATAYLTEVYTKQSSEGVFSPEFQQIIRNVEEADLRSGAEMGYFDCDVLTQSQDPGTLKGVEILSVGQDTITAKVKGGFGNGSINVTVVRVDGKLYIDDINGEKAKAAKYLKQ